MRMCLTAAARKVSWKTRWFKFLNLLFKKTKLLKLKSCYLVLLCPTSEFATLVSFETSLSDEEEKQVLEHWAKFYHFKLSQLEVLDKSTHIPPLVSLRTASNAIISYPSKLVFLPTDTKLSPSAVSGLNGTMGLNHGLIEDLGAKVSRSMYQSTLKRFDSDNKAFIDYWSYQDPVILSGNKIIDSLSMIDTNYQQDQLLLHRALVEPIVSSPIMNAKSVIPINGTPLLGNTALYKKYQQRNSPSQFTSNSNMGLVEFTSKNFQIQEVEDVKPVLGDMNSSNDADSQLQIDRNENIKGDSHVPLVIKKSPPSAMDISETQQTSESQLDNSVEQNHPLVNDFSMLYDMNTSGDPWNDNEDFGDLDLDVTEADFDFFKTPAPAPVLTPNNVLNIIPMEISPVVTEAETKQEVSNSEIKLETDYQDTSQDIDEPMEETPLNNDSLFTPFVISNEGTQDVSVNSSYNTTADPSTADPSTAATPNKTQCNQSAPNVPKKAATYEKPAYEPSNFVPHDFLPVAVNTTSIDRKYGLGGKFMYDPSSKSTTEPPPKPENEFKRGIYTADYVPLVKSAKKSQDKAKEFKSQVKEPEDAKMTEAEDDNSSSSGSDSHSSDSTSGSSSSSDSEDESGSSDSSEFSGEEEGDVTGDHATDKRLRMIKRFQKSVVQCLLKATPAPQPSERQRHLDYDTPFAPVLADASTKPIKWRQSEAMSKSLEYLCQQAIWGGYPFSGGLSDVSENGGEIEGESDKVLAARRTNLMQVTRGVVTHVPSVLTDLQQLTKEFKSMLTNIFVTSDTVNAAVENIHQGAGELSVPNSYIGASSLPGLIDVKGPLNIQQYYSLSGNT